MSDIVVFGSFVVDLMARSAHIPVPGETIKSSPPFGTASF